MENLLVNFGSSSMVNLKLVVTRQLALATRRVS